MSILIVLSLLAIVTATSAQTIDRDYVTCDVQRRVCECREDAFECDFTLVIEELQTFTSYTIEEDDTVVYSGPVEQREVPRFREEEGNSYYFNSSGHLQPLFTDDGHVCITLNEDFDSIKCTIPYTADGRTYRPFIAINGIAPGPTLIVYEGQSVIVSVVNRLITESTSIHWHGMDMRNTPWMDGVVLVTQCAIDPFETFRYYFQAAPTGTYWYHSHRVEQRADGLFGGLVIRESVQRRLMLEGVLGAPIIDDPGTQNILLHEWAEGTTLDLFTRIKGGLEFFPDKPFGEIPLPPSEQTGPTPYLPYDASSGPDGLEVGDIPFWSGLINGKGRHNDVPYNKSRLEIFTVRDDGGLYRFRLVGAQSLYALKFSIDEHNLTVISTDGSLVEPVETQFIIIHTGERYDFIVKGQKPRDDINDYWIRAETLEVDLDAPGPPYPSAGNAIEGILHYRQTPDQLPRATDYHTIKQNSIPYNLETCANRGGCLAVNCPFLNFHPSYNTRCYNVDQLRRLEPTPSEQMPSAEVDPDCPDCEIFFNIGSDHDSLNGRNMRLPPAPPLTQADDILPDQYCNLQQPCPDNQPCSCTHKVEIDSFNKTIRIVLSAIGNDIEEGEGSSHPFHLHGHQFHVVAVGYGPYNGDTGLLVGPRDDIVCDDALCSNPSWAEGRKPSFEISNTTLRKDTIIVPGGGYVVLQFRSDNPGLWFLHCHIVPDLLEGMSVMIDEVRSRQNPPPDNINRCGDFRISQALFYEKLEFDPSNTAEMRVASYLCVLVVSVFALIVSF